MLMTLSSELIFEGHARMALDLFSILVARSPVKPSSIQTIMPRKPDQDTRAAIFRELGVTWRAPCHGPEGRGDLRGGVILAHWDLDEAGEVGKRPREIQLDPRSGRSNRGS
jgi:hypothetical protein